MAFLAVIPALLACGSGSAHGEAGPAAKAEPRVATAAAEQCPVSFIEGIDVFDGQGAVDWSAVRDAGIAFAFIKATQGTYDIQATFAENWRASRGAGLVRGAYHFFDPTEDGAAQAAYFLSVAGVPGPGDLPPVLDVECPDGDENCLGTGSSGAASAADVRSRLWAFLHAVDQATGVRPMLYTFASYFADNGIDTVGLDAYPLYLAWVPPAASAGPSCLGIPAPWSSAAFWQYSFQGVVEGITGAVDRDRFLASMSALSALAVGAPLLHAGCP